MRDTVRLILVIVLASVANAGIVASTTTDLRDLTLIRVSDIWLLPGLILVGTLLSLAIGDLGRSALALITASVVGSLLFALAVAGPGFSISAIRVTLIDRATNYGLLSLLMCLLFGFAGLVVSWLIDAALGGQRWDERH